MTQPALSIVIPVYNTSSYLDRCLSPLIGQVDATSSQESVEILLINDGSKDDSPVICDRYANSYSYIFAFHKENGGLASARNEGIKNAKGEYITFMDSDDWWSDGALEEFLSIIKEYHPDIIGFGCQKTTDTSVFKKYCQRWNEGLIADMSEIHNDIINDKKLFNFGVIRSSCMHIFRTDLIEKLNLEFVSERIVLNEDYLFVSTYITHAQNYYCCKKYYYNYYYRENSLTKTYLTNMYERKTNLMEQYQKYIHDVYTDNKDAIYRLKLFFIDNCYECLANECSQKNPDKKVIARILNDVKNKNILSDIKLEEQSRKGRIILHIMKQNSPAEYIAFYKVFKMAKNIKFKLQKRKHVE